MGAPKGGGLNFWLKPFWQTTLLVRVRLFALFCVLLLHPLSAVHLHATQGMDRCSHRVGADWPLAPGHSARRSEAARPGQGRPSQPVNRPLTKVQSLAAALEALGPEDSTAKTEIQAALQRAKAASTPAPRVQWTPDAAKEAARMKVVRLEKALEVLQDCSGPEIEGLKSAFEESQRSCAGTTSGEADCGVQRVHRAQPEEDRSRDTVARGCTPTIGTFGATSCSRSDSARGSRRSGKRGPSPGKIGGSRSREGRTPVPKTTGNDVHPLSDPMGPECPDSSNARRRAGVVRLVARKTHRSQGCPRIWDTERDSANDIHGGRWCRQAGRIHDHGDHVKGGRIQQRFCGGGRDSRYGLRGVRVGEASNPGPVLTRQARRADRVLVREDEPLQNTVQDSMSTTRSRRRRRPGLGTVIRSWMDQSSRPGRRFAITPTSMFHLKSHWFGRTLGGT